MSARTVGSCVPFVCRVCTKKKGDKKRLCCMCRSHLERRGGRKGGREEGLLDGKTRDFYTDAQEERGKENDGGQSKKKEKKSKGKGEMRAGRCIFSL